MNDQPGFADLDYQQKRRRTRREEFLERMDSLTPWRRLEERIEPYHFRGARSRRPDQRTLESRESRLFHMS